MTKKAKAFAQPQDWDDCDNWIQEVGARQRDLQRIETRMNGELALVKARAEQDADPHRQNLEALIAGIRGFCKLHRATLTEGGKTKTHQFGAGAVSWRDAPPKVSISKKVKAEGVVEWLLACVQTKAGARFLPFLRAKHELNKEALLANPDVAAEIPGVSIKSAGEGFYVKPFETELEESV